VKKLLPGDVVRVRTSTNIAETLAANGTLDGLPFMPEMLRYSGREFTVRNRADKTCDTVDYSGLRQLEGTVHLDNLRCDGSAHGGCQADCSLFWKEEWLGLISTSADTSLRPIVAISGQSLHTGPPEVGRGSPPEDRANMLAQRSGRLHGRHPQRETYSCQATEVRNASRPLPARRMGQYFSDWRTGNTTLGSLFYGLLVYGFNRWQGMSHVLPSWARIRNGSTYPFVMGPHSSTPQRPLGLQAGEIVRVRPREEIFATLDQNGRNRGLSFDPEMLDYCGSLRRVRRRVSIIIDEKTGRLKNLSSDCVLLEDVTCHGRYRLFCPRNQYFFWREIWLERCN